jgi:eukaryotic-like serine/threonine-protein kinase
MSDLLASGPPPSEESWGYERGQVLAERYELERVVGRGGTAVVWVARDSVLDIEVAVKIVPPSMEDIHGDMKRRTVQEARLSAQLTDPAVCRVLDFGFTFRGDPFVVSELLEGETLEDHSLRVGRLGEVEAVRLLLPILDALGAAHRKGIVHRDVKPANVFLARSDGRMQPKLLDFGIACSLHVGTRSTVSGLICGTPCYMSPEQARGCGDIDLRSDLWSFCVMTYELISGTAPFLSDNYHATLFAIANQTAPSLTTFGCDERLAKIFERGMEKERELRWRSAPELANALARWLVEQGVETDACGVSLRRRFLEASVLAEDDVSSARAVSFSLAEEPSSGLKPRPSTLRSGVKGRAVSGLFVLGVAALAGVVLARGGGRLPEAPEATPASPAVADVRVESAPAPRTPAATPVTTPVTASEAGLVPVPPLPAEKLVAPRARAAPRVLPPSKPQSPAPALRPAPPARSTDAPVTGPIDVHAAARTEPQPSVPAKPRTTPRNALRYDFGL